MLNKIIKFSVIGLLSIGVNNIIFAANTPNNYSYQSSSEQSYECNNELYDDSSPTFGEENYDYQPDFSSSLSTQFYLGIAGGSNFGYEQTLVPPVPGIVDPINYAMGYKGSIVGGINLANSLTLELESVYNMMLFNKTRTARGEVTTLNGWGPIINLGYKLNSVQGFADIKPIVSAGVGYLWQSISDASKLNSAYVSEPVTAAGFAYQGKIGFEYAFSDKLALTLAYEFVKIPGPSKGFNITHNKIPRWDYYYNDKILGPTLAALKAECTDNSHYNKVLNRYNEINIEAENAILAEAINDYKTAIMNYKEISLFGKFPDNEIYKVLHVASQKEDEDRIYEIDKVAEEVYRLTISMVNLKESAEFLLKDINDKDALKGDLEQADNTLKFFPQKIERLQGYMESTEALAKGSSAPLELKLPLMFHGPRITLTYRFNI